MKNKVFKIVGLLITNAFFIQFINAQSPEYHWNLFMGYKFLHLNKYTINHDTHPGDWFLPDADVPGSAGTSELHRMHHCLVYGFGYHPRLSKSFSVSFDLEFLTILQSKSDSPKNKRINDNEIRPDDGYYHPSFIYSKVSDCGGSISTDLLYHIKSFYIGIEAQLEGIWIVNGWYRYASNYDCQVKKREFLLMPLYGPKIGFRMGEFGYIEGTMLFGKAIGFGIQIGGYL